MDVEKGNKTNNLFSRRRFIGALGGAAASAALLSSWRGAGAPAATVPYQDSFGNILPTDTDTIAAGVYPPPVSGGPPTTQVEPDACGGNCGSSTCVSQGYPKYNILLIMVDQWRTPRWFPSSGPGIYSVLPNITNLRGMSFVFSNYFVAASACSPSRATLLTGLYAQQNCIFRTQDAANPYPPALQPGFANIATVLSQNGGPLLNYQTTWIGKWHESDNPVESGQPGANGPSDYGFCATPVDYCIPNSASNSPFRRLCCTTYRAARTARPSLPATTRSR